MKTRACTCCNGSGKELDPAAVGAGMRSLRWSRNLTLLTVARQMQLSESYLSELERGHRKWTDDLIKRFKSAINQINIMP